MEIIIRYSWLQVYNLQNWKSVPTNVISPIEIWRVQMTVFYRAENSFFGKSWAINLFFFSNLRLSFNHERISQRPLSLSKPMSAKIKRQESFQRTSEIRNPKRRCARPSLISPPISANNKEFISRRNVDRSNARSAWNDIPDIGRGISRVNAPAGPLCSRDGLESTWRDWNLAAFWGLNGRI